MTRPLETAVTTALAWRGTDIGQYAGENAWKSGKIAVVHQVLPAPHVGECPK
jgi:hypothetical protein